MGKFARLADKGVCTYCKRTVTPPRKGHGSQKLTSATRDHVMPQSRGGQTWVLSCRHCNEIKGDLLPADWRAFMAAHPLWWKTFRTSAEVQAAVKAIRASQAAMPERWCAPIHDAGEGASL